MYWKKVIIQRIHGADTRAVARNALAHAFEQ